MIVVIIALILGGAALLFGIAALDGIETAATLEAEDRQTIAEARDEDREVDTSELNLDPETGRRNN